MVNALIIDDEQKARNLLHGYIMNYIPEIGQVMQANSVRKAFEILQYFKPDIVFLDIEMPHQSGFDFLAARSSPSFDVVFTTAYDQYAIQAIRFSALDYLLKPVDPEELREAVSRHLKKAASKPVDHRTHLYENFMANLKRTDARDFRLAVTTVEGVFFFTLNEIVRLEAYKNYTSIHLDGKRPFLSSKTLKHYEDMLADYGFIRTHKSHMVNPDFIDQMTHNNQAVLLTDGTKVEVSRRKKEEVQMFLRLR